MNRRSHPTRSDETAEAEMETAAANPERIRRGFRAIVARFGLVVQRNFILPEQVGTVPALALGVGAVGRGTGAGQDRVH